MKYRLVFTLVALLIRSGVALPAQELGSGSVRASVEREAAWLASTRAAHDQTSDRSTSVSTSAFQIDRSDEWDAVRQLRAGARILVATSQDRRIKGRMSAVSADVLRMIDREGRDQMLRRDEVLEVRLDHRLSVGQYVGLGILVGGTAGLAIGHANECDCELRGLGKIMGAITGTVGGGLGGWMIGGGVDALPGRLIYRFAKP